MRARFGVVILLSLLTAAGCSSAPKSALQTKPAAIPSASALPTTLPETLLGKRGVIMNYEAATRAINFRPFLPSKRPREIALLHPFRSDDEAARRGIGFSYDRRGTIFVLRQWPLAGEEPTAYRAVPPIRGCVGTYRIPTTNGLIVTGNNGRIFTLETDGVASARELRSEATRLAARGLCR